MNRLVIVRFILCAVFGFASLFTAIAATGAGANVIQMTARRFEFSPSEITVKKGQPVVLEIKSEDVKHGFSLPDFNVDAAIKPGEVTKVQFIPDKAGQFTFVCDVFCGDGHEDMQGTIKVTE